jgi:hypothetical protein
MADTRGCQSQNEAMPGADTQAVPRLGRKAPNAQAGITCSRSALRSTTPQRNMRLPQPNVQSTQIPNMGCPREPNYFAFTRLRSYSAADMENCFMSKSHRLSHILQPTETLGTAPSALRAVATGAVAVGGFALGAIAVGAVAVGALAIGRMAVGRARIGRLEIDELSVRRLVVTEGLLTPQGMAIDPSTQRVSEQTSSPSSPSP